MLTVLSLLSPLFSGLALADTITIDTGVVIEGSLARWAPEGDCQIAVAEGALQGATLTLPCARVVHFDRKIPDFQPQSQAPMQVEDLEAGPARIEAAPVEVAEELVEAAPVEVAPVGVAEELVEAAPALAPELPEAAAVASPVAPPVPAATGRVPSPPRVGTRREVEPIPVPVPTTSLTW